MKPLNLCQNSFSTGDLARLEAAGLEAMLAEEDDRLDPSRLAGLTMEDFSVLRLSLRQSGKLLTLAYPASAWLGAFRGNANIPREAPERASEWVYVYRPHDEVKRILLTEAAYFLLSRFAEETTMQEALDKLSRERADLGEETLRHLQEWFASWCRLGFFKCPMRCHHVSGR
jgi:hypothetical protein